MGSEINKAKEGITNQKILLDNSEIAFTSLLSIYSQIKDIIDITGIDTIIAPTKELLLEISEINTISIADIITFIK